MGKQRLEKDDEKELVKLLQSFGWLVIPSEAKAGYSGTPDLIAVSPAGDICGIEVKRPGGRLSAGQLLFLKRAKTGFFAIKENGKWVFTSFSGSPVSLLLSH